MKTFLLTVFAMSFLFTVKAQKTDTLKGLAIDTMLITAPEYPPHFLGGDKALKHYLANAMVYPSEAKEKKLRGTVVVSMIVEKDGSLSHLEVEKSVEAMLDREALRVLNSSPKWVPGLQNGIAVRVAATVPINFSLSTGN